MKAGLEVSGWVVQALAERCFLLTSHPRETAVLAGEAARWKAGHCTYMETKNLGARRWRASASPLDARVVPLSDGVLGRIQKRSLLF